MPSAGHVSAVASPQASAATAAAAPAPSAPANGAPTAAAAASQQGDAAAAARLQKYWAAMGQGRKASVQKKFADALAAFDRALEVLPDDARAYAERGYARLLAKSYGPARDDFDRAVLRTDDPKLLAQIWFNYGLTAEEEGRADDARSAFARSNDLNPSQAASAKLGTRSTCTARVTKKDDPQLSSKSVATPSQDDFLTAFQQLTAGRNPAKTATTSDEARSLLCPSGDCMLAPGQGTPIRFQIGSDTLYGAVIALADNKLRVFPKLGITESGSCGASDVVTVKHQQPFLFRIERSKMIERFEGPSQTECTAANSATCTRRCVPGTSLVQDLAFNVAGDGISLFVDQWKSPGGKTPWEVEVNGTDLRILGSGCDIRWDLK